MSMDTPATESNAPLSVNQAASLFSAPAKEPEQQSPASPEPAKVESLEIPEATQTETTSEAAPTEDTLQPEMVEVDIDGFKVQVPKDKAETLEKERLRQADYTRKTMAAAEERKAAEAERTKALQERQQYAQGLQQAQSLLQAQLQEQSQIDWQKLLETDPVEYLKQQHLANARQAKLNQIQQEQQHIAARWQAEQAQAMSAFLQSQQQELLAKLPEWKDESKAKAERDAIKSYLKESGFQDQEIDSISDHRAVVLSRKAMLYDQMMAKAKAAAQKVQNLPQKVERPGGGETNPLDGRTVAIRRLAQSGSVNDAASAFAALRKRS